MTFDNSFAREEWKVVKPGGEEFTNGCWFEISNWGRLRSFNAISKGKIVQGSIVNGYRIIRQRMFKPRDEKSTLNLQQLQVPVADALKNVGSVKKELKNKKLSKAETIALQKKLDTAISVYKDLKSKYDAVYEKDAKKRTTYYGALIHRLVAENFIPKPSDKHTVVAHLDYDKLNNKADNLRWMTSQENHVHQQSSPQVKAEQLKRKQFEYYDEKKYKLTVTKVMFLKKLLNEGKSCRSLAKQFKVSETQIMNIKKNLSWGGVEAAK